MYALTIGKEQEIEENMHDKYDVRLAFFRMKTIDELMRDCELLCTFLDQFYISPELKIERIDVFNAHSELLYFLNELINEKREQV